jgi:hypothetical protein
LSRDAMMNMPRKIAHGQASLCRGLRRFASHPPNRLGPYLNNNANRYLLHTLDIPFRSKLLCANAQSKKETRRVYWPLNLVVDWVTIPFSKLTAAYFTTDALLEPVDLMARSAQSALAEQCAEAWSFDLKTLRLQDTIFKANMNRA